MTPPPNGTVWTLHYRTVAINNCESLFDPSVYISMRDACPGIWSSLGDKERDLFEVWARICYSQKIVIRGIWLSGVKRFSLSCTWILGIRMSPGNSHTQNKVNIHCTFMEIIIFLHMDWDCSFLKIHLLMQYFSMGESGSMRGLPGPVGGQT